MTPYTVYVSDTALQVGPLTYHIPVDLIKVASYNPEGRDDASSAHLKGLIKSLAHVGQLAPVSVSRLPEGTFHLNDGHRRLAAARALGQATVWAVITEAESSECYEHLNSEVKPHSPTEKLQTFLKNPEAVTRRSRTAFEAMLKHIGRRTVEKLSQQGYTLATYRQALKVSRYCGQKEKAVFVRKVLRWLITTKSTKAVRKALEEGRAASEIMVAINEGVAIS